jgi:predicted transcriptional regulator
VKKLNRKNKVAAKEEEARQRLLDLAAQADESEGIRQGLEDMKNGRTRPAREVLEAFRRSRPRPAD